MSDTQSAAPRPSGPREIVLQPGQRTDLKATGERAGFLYCLTGSVHLVGAGMGVGWVMQKGDGCLLRTPMDYRVRARTPVRLVFRADAAVETDTPRGELPSARRAAHLS